jgi:hypothetical protein
VAKSGARLREYEVSLSWLEDAGLVHRIENVQTAETPLMVHKNKSSFKLYLFDCGLLAALSGLSPALITDENELFFTFKGAFIENSKQAKSLAVYSKKYNPRFRSCASKRMFVMDADFVNIPLYAVGYFSYLLGISNRPEK